MDIEILKSMGLSETSGRIYLHLIERGQQTPTEMAEALGEKRPTIYAAVKKLVAMGIVSQKDRGKIAAYVPNHPAALEVLAEKRLRVAAKQSRNLEVNLPTLINYYNERQTQPGVTTFYGAEGVRLVRRKIVAMGQPLYFVRSPFDDREDADGMAQYIKDRVAAKIPAENISPSEYTNYSEAQQKAWLLDRTLLPPDEYDSPVEIAIFGDDVAFIDHGKDALSTVVESPAIADAMRQFFQFSKKYLAKSTDQAALLDRVEQILDSDDAPDPQTSPSDRTPLGEPSDSPSHLDSAPDSLPRSPSPEASPGELEGHQS